MSEFFQAPPTLSNQFTDDVWLRSYLERKLPAKMYLEIQSDLQEFGEKTSGEYLELAREAVKQKPVHVPYDAWGKRIDKIEVSEAWRKFDEISAKEKLIAIAYEKKYGEYSRIYQFAKLYLFQPSSAIYTCPLAMTDGAARALELYGDDRLKASAFKHLTSSDPKEFWTSGQWMTERTGGSDVSGTSTIAKKDASGNYRLYGSKWFTSATTSQMAMTLARIEGAEEGSRGLSLFYIELRNSAGDLQNIQVNRLKDKLGTDALPTAELTLEGTPAILVGGEGNGVKKISSLFNITRVYNACCASGDMRRSLVLAKEYAKLRKAFGKSLKEHSLHVETLAHMHIETDAAFLFTFRAVELLGKLESNVASREEEVLLRLLTPLVKLYTGKQVVAQASEVLESFGGAGYVEDTGLPRLLRDSQVLSIWEGTTNILSLDMLRALLKEQAFQPYTEDILARLQSSKREELEGCVQKTQVALEAATQFLVQYQTSSIDIQQRGARQLAFGLSQIFIASLMIEHAHWALEKQAKYAQRFVLSAQRWCEKTLFPEIDLSESRSDDSSIMVFG